MSTIKSSAENLTLNADGANNDMKFQSNGTEVASIDQAGTVTATTFTGAATDATKLPLAGGTLTGALTLAATADNIVSNGSVVIKGGLSANQTSGLALFQENGSNSTIKVFGADAGDTGTLNVYVAASDGSPDSKIISVSADGLKFNGDTAAANALDDYEEGTFTPACSAWGSITNQSCKYTKIGRLVTIQVYVDGGSANSNTVFITGLPFSNVHKGWSTGSLNYANSNPNHTNPHVRVVESSASVGILKNGDTSMVGTEFVGHCIFTVTYMTA